MNLNNVAFVKSAAASAGFIDDGLPQIVFSGRSNVGKSSVINRLLSRRNLARVSSSPGKTIHINYFLVDGTAYFVDLPGYGYAKVAKTERDRWSELMESYFSGSAHITLGVMIVDARHKPTDNDLTMAEWFRLSECPLVVVANKIDKVKTGEKDGNLALIRDTLKLSPDTLIIPFSAEQGTNKEALVREIMKSVKTGRAAE